MVKVWTIGIFWGIFSWIPYFIDLPLLFLLKVTIGLPVVCAVYLGVFLEKILSMFSEQVIIILRLTEARLPNNIYFGLSLLTGIGLSWLIKVLIKGRADSSNWLREKEVE